jgi:hypothetical protein
MGAVRQAREMRYNPAMLKLMAVTVVLLGACSEEPAPSCQDAITNFYGAGCVFTNLSTTPATPYTLNEAITSCKQVLMAVPDRCQSYFDDYQFCLDGVRSSSQCTDCTQEQDALFGCQ